MNKIIYILINEAMFGYIKIGKTADLAQRVKDLSRASGVPLPFEVFYAAEVDDADFVEKQIHEAFGRTRVAQNREFFTETPERVVAVIKLREINEVTTGQDFVEDEADRQALARVKRYKKRYDFTRYEIPVGAVLIFTRDATKTCVVVDGDNVEYGGDVMSVSKAAQRALDVPYGVQGPAYWEYQEQTLDERRRERQEQGAGEE